MKLMALARLKAAAPPQGKSAWVWPGAGGKRRYQTDAVRNRIMDLSRAGYRGGARIPSPAAAVRLAPAPGDNTARIQAATNEPAKRVLLGAGAYDVAGTVRWRIVGLAFTATATDYLDRQTLSVAAPVPRERFHPRLGAQALANIGCPAGASRDGD